MAKQKKWTKKDYELQAREFVSCYGDEATSDEFLYEYAQLFEGKLPFDPDTLRSAIYAASQKK